uniref:acyltransferase family protein n=1 Tax=uncultured Draconibacterium sp. TaxID=1573823 RepID=UPI0032164CCE
MENTYKYERLHSLDALRGFDMFWIMGGSVIFIELGKLTGWPILEWWSEQLNHVEWHGFHFYDMIFPLFLFLAGVSFPFSLAKRLVMNNSHKTAYSHIVKRGLILVIFGILYNNGVSFNFSEMRYGSVLGHIGLAWMFAALIFMNTSFIYRIIWFWALLIGYWLLLLFFPAPDLFSTDPFSLEGNLPGYLDRLLSPGTLYLGVFDPSGFFTTPPSIGTALLGMLTGEFVLSKRLHNTPLRKFFYMVFIAGLLLIIGKVWNTNFPINKMLWSSSFVCWAGGLSLLFFAVFYLAIDIWKFKNWAFPFRVIGMNPLTIYLALRIVNAKSASRFFFEGINSILPESWNGIIINGIGVATVSWIFLFILYKKKIFLKI